MEREGPAAGLVGSWAVGPGSVCAGVLLETQPDLKRISRIGGQVDAGAPVGMVSQEVGRRVLVILDGRMTLDGTESNGERVGQTLKKLPAFPLVLLVYVVTLVHQFKLFAILPDETLKTGVRQNVCEGSQTRQGKQGFGKRRSEDARKRSRAD